MAIVQISRITNRKGLEVDLPQPLAGAELGWAIDERRLWIGNGELAEGAPVVGNTEILTEFSDILGFATAYTYTGEHATGYVAQTGPTPSDPVTQSLQARLDSYAIITDFGAVGDGVTDNTAAINRALYQLYCVEVNPTIRRSLFFPAGVYVVTAPILVPPYATLYGDGVNGSIISLVVQQWTSGVSYQQGVLVVDNGVYYRSLIPVPVNVSISNTTYWAEDVEPACVVQTADSLQQTGVNIGTNGATAPQSISITNMEFSTTLEINGLLVENATNCSFTSLSFQGPLTESIITDYAIAPTVTAGNFVVGQDYQIVTLGTTDWNTTAGTTGITYHIGDEFTAATVGDGDGTADFLPTQISAIAWASTPAYVCKNITFNNCQFNGFWHGIATEQQIKGITVTNSSFDTLYQGVYLGGAAPVDGGATGFRILHNIFDNIYYQGIVFDTVSLNASGYNVFYDVGNGFNGVDYPVTPVIEFYTPNNISIGDMFERTDDIVESSGVTRVEINDTASIASTNGSELSLGTYTRYSGLQQTLVDNTANATLFTVNAVTTRAFNFDYTVVRNYANVRTGVVTVVASTDGAGSVGDLTINDSGFQNSSTGVTFSVVESSSVITVRYSTTSTGNDATLYYSVTKLA